MEKETNYEKDLLERLKNPEFAAAYLNEILEDNDTDLLLLALRRVAKAHGFAQISKATELGRESLYKACLHFKSAVHVKSEVSPAIKVSCLTNLPISSLNEEYSGRSVSSDD